MRLDPVKADRTSPLFPPFTYKCFGCGREHATDQVPTFADLDGPAFEAYYGENCLPHPEPPPEDSQ